MGPEERADVEWEIDAARAAHRRRMGLPVEDEPISSEEEEAAQEARDAIQRGEVVSHSEMRRLLELDDE